MGKKLRSREIALETDLESESLQYEPLREKVLSRINLKKMINRKFIKREGTQVGKKFIQRVKNGQITEIINEERFQCPICLDLMIKPTVMNCGHMYCFRCLDSNIAHSKRCCLCRQEQKEGLTPSKYTETVINKIIFPKSQNFINYLCRTTNNTQWVKHREISNIRPGMVVDFHDTFNVWRRALILKTFLFSDQKLMVTLKINIKGIELNETVQATSRRLAPLNFFTRGRYLEQFSPSLPEYDRTEKELHQLEYKNYIQQEEFFTHRSYQYQENEGAVENVSQNELDQALILFNWQMNEDEMLY